MKPYPEGHYSSGSARTLMKNNYSFQEVVRDCIYHIIILRNREKLKQTKEDFIELYEHPMS